MDIQLSSGVGEVNKSAQLSSLDSHLPQLPVQPSASFKGTYLERGRSTCEHPLLPQYLQSHLASAFIVIQYLLLPKQAVISRLLASVASFPSSAELTTSITMADVPESRLRSTHTQQHCAFTSAWGVQPPPWSPPRSGLFRRRSVSWPGLTPRSRPAVSAHATKSLCTAFPHGLGSCPPPGPAPEAGAPGRLQSPPTFLRRHRNLFRSPPSLQGLLPPICESET